MCKLYFRRKNGRILRSVEDYSLKRSTDINAQMRLNDVFVEHVESARCLKLKHIVSYVNINFCISLLFACSCVHYRLSADPTHRTPAAVNVWVAFGNGKISSANIYSICDRYGV